MEVIVEKFGKVPVPEELHKLIKQEVLKANKKLSTYKKIRHFEIREGEFEDYHQEDKASPGTCILKVHWRDV